MTKIQLIGFIVLLISILISPFVSFPNTPFSTFRGLELKPDGRLLANEIRTEAQKKEKLDILFLARSSMQSAINAAELEKKLSTDSRKVKVFISGIKIGDTYSALKILESFLENRKIDVVIMSDDFLFTSPQLYSALIFNEKDMNSIQSKMGWREKLEVYRNRLLAMPVIIREFFMPLEISPRTLGIQQIEEFRKYRGTYFEDGFLFKGQKAPARIRKDVEGPPISLSQVLKKSEKDSDYAQYVDGQYSMYFFKQIIRLSRDHGARLYLFRDLRYNRRQGQGVVLYHQDSGYADWNQQFEGTLSFSKEQIFRGVSSDDISWYFSSIPHLNRAGNELFTNAIAPALKEIISEAN